MEAGVVVVKTEQDVDMPLPVKKKGRIARMQDLTKDEADTAGADANATGAGESGDDDSDAEGSCNYCMCFEFLSDLNSHISVSSVSVAYKVFKSCVESCIYFKKELFYKTDSHFQRQHIN